MARALDGDRELALVDGGRAGDFPGHDLAALVHELAQQLVVLVVDELDLVFGEVADFLPLGLPVLFTTIAHGLLLPFAAAAAVFDGFTVTVTITAFATAFPEGRAFTARSAF